MNHVGKGQLNDLGYTKLRQSNFEGCDNNCDQKFSMVWLQGKRIIFTGSIINIYRV